MERQAFHLDQLRYLEQRAKHDAQLRLVSGGQLPANLPPGFEIGGPPQPQPQVQVANVTAPSSVTIASSSASASSALPTSLTVTNSVSIPSTQTITSSTVTGTNPVENPPGNYLKLILNTYVLL